MKIRFGYVANALNLYDATPSKTMTFARYQKLSSPEREDQLEHITRTNLQHTIRALHYNIGHEILLYRFSSSLVPLATHDKVEFDYITPFQKEYESIGALVRAHKLRTSFHPNQFTLFTSDKPHVTENAVKDMEYHYRLLKAMGLEREGHINLHVGGAYGDKTKSLERFHKNLKQLPARIKQQMTLENDDKTYTTTETLQVCERERIPMMFDYHHYMANHDQEERLEDLLPRFFQTWSHMPPKIHISSPKSQKEYRSHADFVDVEFIKPLLQELKKLGQDVDFMIEAKQKDRAVLKIIEDISSIRGVKRISGGSVKI
ncbi:UV DNA damage endonuclease [Halobacillus andaensis]|uniref:UV DNA damage endonuclease n=1 Tax=Halobacillus andaensis TaxID=1176239 RepID=A0A917F1S9_HALAA|nr:UV DNA damage repair endonuclease UvsE [Halobacillus andaensis]MBP2006344.1 UV DNA damage endonuclease [Halobacillus andaensis]GGF34397.1 UV DNA damage endonuclease [Halobacillus andaensis]